MTWFCLEVLHRTPEEIDLPLYVLTRSMLAWVMIRERQDKKLQGS